MANQIIRKTFRFRLYPTKAQVAGLESQLSEACRLYNAALQERRDAWHINRKSLNYYDQANQLKEIRANGDLALANFSACQDVLRRVDKTFKAFFARVRRGVKAGFPRFKSQSRFDSFTFPSYGDGCRMLDSGKLRLQGIGLAKVKLHRPVDGKIKTVTVKREAGRWYVCLSVECEANPLPASTEAIGIDVGLSAFATLSDGTEIENPRWFKEAQKRLRRAQRKVARRKKGSKRRRKAVQLLQRAHAHVRHKRADFQHKISRWLVGNYELIAAEDLNIKGLASGMLAKSVNDAGWGTFLDMIAYKAAEAGRKFVRVNPNGTTQVCSGCGTHVAKSLSQRVHRCSACSLELGRDENAARNILALGLSVLGITCPVGESVPREAACFLLAE
jgi:putative transposase